MKGRFVCYSLTCSLTHSAVSSIHPNIGKNSIYGHKNINPCVIKKIPPYDCEAVNTEEVFYMFSLRYTISLKIDSLPSNLHTKRIHSDGKSVYSKTKSTD